MAHGALARASQHQGQMVLWTLLILGYALAVRSLKRQERFEPVPASHPGGAWQRSPVRRHAGQQQSEKGRPMKKLEATVPPFTMEAVGDALVRAGVDGMSVTEVRVLGPHARTACYRGTRFDIPFAAQCKIEVIVRDDQVARCLEAVRGAADGSAVEIVLLPLEDSVGIRTGEHARRAA